MSLEGSSVNCELAPYPGPSQYPASAAYLEELGAVVACGGNRLEDSTSCWMFDGSTWTSLPDSNQQHCLVDTPSLMVDQGWWVTGQRQTGDHYCSDDEWTSEIYTGEDWVPGPGPPNDTYSTYACLVNINETHTIHTGGRPTYSEAWLYDWTTDTWTQTGSLNAGRNRHGCVTLEDQRVLAVGGYNSGEVYAVELYDPVKGSWSPQPDLPMDIISPYSPALLSSDGNVLAFFRFHDQIFKYDKNDGKWSPLEGTKLPGNFNGNTVDNVVLVPIDFAPNCLEIENGLENMC